MVTSDFYGDDKLHLPVDCLAWQYDVGERCSQAGRELCEGRRAGGHRQAGLRGVVAVVHADREYLCWSGRRRPELVVVDGRGRSRWGPVRPGAERPPLPLECPRAGIQTTQARLLYRGAP